VSAWLGKEGGGEEEDGQLLEKGSVSVL
jgi:hypothetical protein